MAADAALPTAPAALHGQAAARPGCDVACEGDLHKAPRTGFIPQTCCKELKSYVLLVWGSAHLLLVQPGCGAQLLDVCDVLLWPRAGMGQRGDPPPLLAPWAQMPACDILG